MILETIKKEQKQARIKRDKFRAGILTTLMAEVAIVGKNAGRETTDVEAIKVVRKFLKGAKENLSFALQEKDFDKIADFTSEINIYNEFMPKQMTERELTEAIGIFLGDNAGANIGQVMKYLKDNFDTKYNGKTASKLVREIL